MRKKKKIKKNGKEKKSRSFIDKNASGHYYEYILRLFDNKKKKAKPYEGYKGNEAVVSPVTFTKIYKTKTKRRRGR